MKKWKLINELLDRLNGRNFHEFLTEEPKELKMVCYAPRIGYYAWIFVYKGVYMCFMDNNNGWWSFHSAVSWIDILLAKYDGWKARREKCRRRKLED